MATRTTEAVLRQDVAKSEVAVEKAKEALATAEARLSESRKAKDGRLAGLAEARANLSRSEAALAAYLPSPLRAGAEEASDGGGTSE